MAGDVWTAFRKGEYGAGRGRPWLGWVLLFEDRTSSAPSNDRRYEQALRKFVHERLIDSAAFLASIGKGSAQGAYLEPAVDLTMKRFLASLMGRVGGHLALAGLRSGSFHQTPPPSCGKRGVRHYGNRPARVPA